LEKTLAKPQLDKAYRAYLERTAKTIDQVHKGYFAASHSDKSQDEAISLILKDKEMLLSFDTDLRFIFSMWALQEGWDNPNVFTLCKLAPSPSKITKLQQIGRGLRLAVNQ
jgi:type III restriction enzyme